MGSVWRSGVTYYGVSNGQLCIMGSGSGIGGYVLWGHGWAVGVNLGSSYWKYPSTRILLHVSWNVGQNASTDNE